MIAEFRNSVVGNVVLLRDIHFINNTCTVTEFSGGGGLVVAFMFDSGNIIEDHYPHSNSFKCLNCTFVGNRAEMGGGASIFVTKTTNKSSLSNISFTNCTWKDNKSPMGAGVFITPTLWDYSREGFLPIPVLTDCTFESNSAIQTLTQSTNESIGVKAESVGFATIYITQLTVVFKGNSNFTQNQGTAVHLSSGVMHFKQYSNVRFVGNTGHNGGAIAMYGTAMILIENSSSFLFKNNSATSRGGGIYNGANHPTYHNCFLSSSDILPVNSTFTFSENTANNSGDSIFTKTFNSCALLCSEVHHVPTEIMQCIANFSFDNKVSSLSTYPEKFSFIGREPVSMIPGKEYGIELSAFDESNNTMSGIVYKASATNSNVCIDPAFSQVSHNRLKLMGKPGSLTEINLITDQTKVSFNVLLAKCMPGYRYSTKLSKCKCSTSYYYGLDGCDPNVYIRHGYWIGYCFNNSGALCTSICPYGYCSYTNSTPLFNFHKLPITPRALDSVICEPRRTSRLCGECIQGHAVYFNSFKYKCGHEKLCYLGWLFYLLSVIIPLTLMFITILVCNINFTRGIGNSFLLYAQVLGSLAFDGNSTQFKKDVRLLQSVVIFPYNFLNLYFIRVDSLSYCLWKGATFMGIQTAYYATVVFALILVLLTFLLNNNMCIRSKILKRFQQRNSFIIHGVSTFLVLCYSNAARTTFHILKISCLYSAKLKCKEKVVHFAGHLTYLGKGHGPYAGIAYTFLVFMILLPPLLLLVYPLVFKLFDMLKMSETKLVHFLWRAMPIQFLDAFQSSFKDKYRFFAGFYFLYRGLVLGLFIITQSDLAYYSDAQVLLTVILTIHAVIQPYKERKHNIIEQLLFANLCIINAITLFYYNTTQDLTAYKYTNFINALGVLQASLTILPLIVFMTWHIATVYCRMRRKSENLGNLPSLRNDENKQLLQM